MSVLAVNSTELENLYKDFYTAVDTKVLYKLSHISKIYYIPRHQTKEKHENACERVIEDLFMKYNLSEDDRWDNQRRYESHYETLMKFNENTNMFVMMNFIRAAKLKMCAMGHPTSGQVDPK